MDPILDNILEEVLQASTNTSDSESENTLTPPSPTETIIMAPSAFDSNFRELSNKAAVIDTLILRFNKETVCLLDAENYKEDLKTIFDKLLEMQTLNQTILSTLRQNVDEEKQQYARVDKLFTATQAKVIKNETEVKKKMFELKEQASSAAASVVSGKEVKKLTTKANQAIARFSSFKEEISKIPPIEDLTEAEIKEQVVETKEWKKKLETYAGQKESLDVEAEVVDIDEGVKTKNPSRKLKEKVIQSLGTNNLFFWSSFGI